MRIFALLAIVVIEVTFILWFLRLHSRAIQFMEMNRGRFWLAVPTYVGWVFFALVIVPVGMYVPFWANREVKAIEVTGDSTIALLICGIVIVLLTTVAGFRVRVR